MLIQSVFNFIKDLQGFKNLTSTDVRLLNCLIDTIGFRAAEEQLIDFDIHFLLGCFKTRWKEIVDSEHDYMLNPGLINQRWIDFAIELAPTTDKNYLQILIPTVINTLDFNNITPLTETLRLQNLYLGYGNKILYRKRGLCEYLISKSYVLSTCRELCTNKENSVSVEELTRLQSCNQKDGQFSINSESFSNFWFFLRKKVFPRLQSRGKMPLDLLPHLLILIEEYYTLKESDASYKVFNQLRHNFFKHIYNNNLDDINFFYGIEILFKGKSFYLLDFLIVINKAECYVLGEHLNALIEWLYSYNPALKATNTNLEPLYKKIERKAVNKDLNLLAPKGDNSNLLTQSLNFLLSMFTTQFDFMPLTGGNITFWDISRPIFSEACNIFSMFVPALNQNKVAELVEQYKIVMSKYIIPDQDNRNFLTWLTRYQSVSDWYQHARDNTLTNWTAPELIMHTLLRYKTFEPRIAYQVNKLLDEIIHTYAQENSELQKQLRVNILFSDFTNNLLIKEKRYLNLLAQLHDRPEIKRNFLSNCIIHITNRLSQINTAKDGGAIHFFSDVRRVDVTKLDISNIRVDHLGTIIDALKARVYEHDGSFDKELADKMITYLRSISRPILTMQEINEAKSSANALDYLGAPT